MARLMIFCKQLKHNCVISKPSDLSLRGYRLVFVFLHPGQGPTPTHLCLPLCTGSLDLFIPCCLPT